MTTKTRPNETLETLGTEPSLRQLARWIRTGLVTADAGRAELRRAEYLRCDSHLSAHETADLADVRRALAEVVS